MSSAGMRACKTLSSLHHRRISALKVLQTFETSIHRKALGRARVDLAVLHSQRLSVQRSMRALSAVVISRRREALGAVRAELHWSVPLSCMPRSWIASLRGVAVERRRGFHMHRFRIPSLRLLSLGHLVAWDFPRPTAQAEIGRIQD